MRLRTARPGACRAGLAVDDRGDAGFTLIELLVTIVILGLIAFPLGNAVLSWVRNSDATSDRLALSHDAQISAAYFARDVAGVGTREYTAGSAPFRASIQIDAAYNAGGHTCGTAATPVAKVRFLSDSWSGSGPAPSLVTDVVAYYLVPVGGVSELHRIKCTGSASPVSDVVLAHHVDPATLTVTCSSACTAATVPQQVTLAFEVTKASVGDYPIVLIGQRRQT